MERTWVTIVQVIKGETDSCRGWDLSVNAGEASDLFFFQNRAFSFLKTKKPDSDQANGEGLLQAPQGLAARPPPNAWSHQVKLGNKPGITKR